MVDVNFDQNSLEPAVASMSVTPQVFYRNADAVEFMYGEMNTVMLSTASMNVAASTIAYVNTGTSATGSTSCAPAYPTGSGNNDLILFAGMDKHETYQGFSNANFKRAGWSHAMPEYPDYRDATGRTAAYNTLGTDIGPSRTEHHLRFPTTSLSGTETFTTTATSNSAAAGAIHRFKKSSLQDWVIKSYGSGAPDSVAGTSSYSVDVGTETQFKVSNSQIRGIGNNPGVCTLVVTQGLELFKSVTGYEWNPISYPFGTDIAYRVRYGNGTWIMVGANGKVGRSTNNGSTWTVTQPLGTGFVWYGVRYYNNRWIACGAGGRLMTSDDGGQNWIQRTSGVSVTIYDVAWGLGWNGVPSNDPNYHAPWNNGVGHWWYSAEGFRMFKSNDNGNTWSEGTYQTTAPLWSNFNSASPETLIYYSDDYYNFLTVGDFLADIYDYGYYQNVINYGTSNSYGGEDMWRPNYSGYSYGMFYGQDVWPKGLLSHVYDSANLYNSTGEAVQRVWWGESRLNGIAIGASETYPSHTYGYWEHDFRATSFQRLGKPFREFPPLTGYWDTQNNRDLKYFIRDGGTWSYIDGSAYGDLFTYNLNGTGTYEGTWDETVASGAPDIRDGDMVVVSIGVSGSADTVSNINIAETSYYSGVTPGMQFSPAIDLGSVTSNSGDRGKIYTRAFYAHGDFTSGYFYEDTYYNVGDSRRYLINTSGPRVAVSWDATCTATRIQGGFSVVVTVIHAEGLTVVDMPAAASLTATADVRKTGVMPGTPGADYVASMTVDAFVEKNTLPVYLGGYSQGNETSSTTLVDYVYSPSTDLPAGTMVFVFVMSDNLSATTPTRTITDTRSNTWNLIGFRGQNATANAGTTASIHYSILTTPLQYGDTITCTFSGAVVCKGMIYLAFGGMSNATQTSTAVTNSGASATPTVTSGTVNSGNVVVGVFGIENDVMPTADSDTLNGSWGSQINRTGSGGNSATHQTIYAAYKIVNASGAQTFNPSTSPSTDWAGVIGVFGSAPTKQTAAVLRPTASLTADMSITKMGTASITGAGSVVGIGGRTGYGGAATGVGTTSATGRQVYTANVTGTGSVTAIGSAGSRASTTGVGSSSAKATVAPIATTSGVGSTSASFVTRGSASVSGVGSTVGGQIHDTTASCTTSVTFVGAGVYVKGGSNPPLPSGDTPPVIVHPDPLPGYEGWFKSTSVYGPTGSTGNLVELTNRHYQDAYIATTAWEDWPFPCGPGGFMGYQGSYTMGARSAVVTPLGGDKFLVTWMQENWVQYYLDWINGQPIQRVLLDVPPILVATVLDCSGDGDPVIVGTTRHDLPLSWRWLRNSYGQSAKPMGDGRVACIWTGFHNIPDHAIAPDYGNISYVPEDSANIVCMVDASTNTPVFEWVKTFGGDWDGIHSYVNEIMVYDGDVFVTRFGYDYTKVAKFSGSSGTFLGSSSAISRTDNPNGISSCLYEGSTGFVYGDNGYLMTAQSINLSTLQWGTEHDVLYNGNTVNPAGKLQMSKKGPDGSWYAGGTTADAGGYAIFKFAIDGQTLSIAAIHRSDVANVNSYDESSLMYGNAYRTYNWVETWVPLNYGQMQAYTLYTKQNFCPGAKFPSVVGTAAYLTDPTGQLPEHQLGPQVVAQIPPIGDDGAPARPKSWISYPEGANLSNWGNYFASGIPQFVCDVDCAELSTGKILVVLAGVEDLLDSGSYTSYETIPGNGIYRIFSYLVDPANEPPPLKMTQRDDDKTAGAARIGYDPGQESTIRAGWVAW
jgi:hypothetical protein